MKNVFQYGQFEDIQWALGNCFFTNVGELKPKQTMVLLKNNLGENTRWIDNE